MPIVIVGGSPAPGPPPAPRLTGLYQRDGSAIALWAPQGDGGSALTRFVVITRNATSGALVRMDQTGSAALGNYTILQLTNGTQYAVTVQAVNMLGTSPESNSGLVTPTAEVVVPPVDPELPEEPPPDDPEPPPPPPPIIIPQPTLYAFPVERTFRPEHWLLTPEEADAL